MNTDRLARLFDKLKQLEQSKPEATLLSIGGRGYYENPASDLLQFFLVPNNAHDLGTLFIEAVLEATGINTVPETSLRTLRVQREVHTANGNRIDLLLKADGWIMLIENKIWHEQINPFEDYEALAKQRMQPGDQEHYVILSPGGHSSQVGWKGLSYRKLIEALQAQLTQHARDFKKTKWWHFAQDFIVHLDQELYTKAMTPEEIEFVEQNYQELAEAAQLQQKYREHLLTHLPALIDGAAETKGASSKAESWCIRLYHPEWHPAEVAWFNAPKDGNRLRLTIYMQGMSEAHLHTAKSTFEGALGMSYWTEANGHCHCWCTAESFDHGNTAEAALLKLSSELFKIMKSIR